MKQFIHGLRKHFRLISLLLFLIIFVSLFFYFVLNKYTVTTNIPTIINSTAIITPIITIQPKQADWNTFEIYSTGYKLYYPQVFSQLFAGAGSTCQFKTQSVYQGTNECAQIGLFMSTNGTAGYNQDLSNTSSTLLNTIEKYGQGKDSKKSFLLITKPFNAANELKIFDYIDNSNNIVVIGIVYKNLSPIVGVSFTISNPDPSEINKTLSDMESILYTISPD